jgi:hypothetical protein
MLTLMLNWMARPVGAMAFILLSRSMSSSLLMSGMWRAPMVFSTQPELLASSLRLCCLSIYFMLLF